MLSIAENLTMASLWRYVRGFHILRAAERTAVGGVIKDLTIKVLDPDLPVSSLSGGNQQKVVIGKALLTDPKVLLMDEPSRGIDVGAKADVFLTMRRLAARGLGILFVTSDLEEVMALSDRIAVMSNGRLTALFDRATPPRPWSWPPRRRAMAPTPPVPPPSRWRHDRGSQSPAAIGRPQRRPPPC